jgi:Flp pilus assembly pilin Flp
MTHVARVLNQQIDAFRRLIGADGGQDLIEYGLLMALIAVFAMGAVSFLGQQVNAIFWQPIVNNF